MSKHRGNRPVPGYFKVSGGKVEDRDYGKSSKQTLGKTRAGLTRRAGRKTPLGEAPPAQRAKEPLVPASEVPRKDAPGPRYARATGSRKRVKAAAAQVDVEQPRYLGYSAVAMARRMWRYAVAPLHLARAVVDRFRGHDEE